MFRCDVVACWRNSSDWTPSRADHMLLLMHFAGIAGKPELLVRAGATLTRRSRTWFRDALASSPSLTSVPSMTNQWLPVESSSGLQTLCPSITTPPSLTGRIVSGAPLARRGAGPLDHPHRRTFRVSG